jgi:hypothetical protein
MASISSKSTPAFHGHEALVADAEEDAEAEAAVEAEGSEEESPVAVRRGTGSSATPPKPSV